MTNNKPVAQIVGDDYSLNGKLCIDDKNRVWEIKSRHSGCSLHGINTDAVIPYWTCYFLILPGLNLIETNPLLPLEIIEPTILDELMRLSLKNKDLIKDESGRRWLVKISEYGIQLNNYEDSENGVLPNCSLGFLSLGKLTKLSSENQRKARRTEYL